jgi:hypothetical protein
VDGKNKSPFGAAPPAARWGVAGVAVQKCRVEFLYVSRGSLRRIDLIQGARVAKQFNSPGERCAGKIRAEPYLSY